MSVKKKTIAIVKFKMLHVMEQIMVYGLTNGRLRKPAVKSFNKQRERQSASSGTVMLQSPEVGWAKVQCLAIGDNVCTNKSPPQSAPVQRYCGMVIPKSGHICRYERSDTVF